MRTVSGLTAKAIAYCCDEAVANLPNSWTWVTRRPSSAVGYRNEVYNPTRVELTDYERCGRCGSDIKLVVGMGADFWYSPVRDHLGSRWDYCDHRPGSQRRRP